MMRIAVTSQNLRTVTGHAGRAQRFLIFEAEPGTDPVEVARIELPKELCMHQFHGTSHHPLDDMDVVLSASCGEGFVHRMARRGILAATTAECDPTAAVSGFVAKRDIPGQAEAVATYGGSRHAGPHKHQHGRQHAAGHGCGCAASQPD